MKKTDTWMPLYIGDYIADTTHLTSGYPCRLYDELFGDWERFERPSFADGARARTEVVWVNSACSSALHQARGGLFAEVAA